MENYQKKRTVEGFKGKMHLRAENPFWSTDITALAPIQDILSSLYRSVFLLLPHSHHHCQREREIEISPLSCLWWNSQCSFLIPQYLYRTTIVVHMGIASMGLIPKIHVLYTRACSAFVSFEDVEMKTESWISFLIAEVFQNHTYSTEGQNSNICWDRDILGFRVLAISCPVSHTALDGT